jgi:polyprenyl P-hydroxybenzoate/phenylacrylic acid decarboxylase-like protein
MPRYLVCITGASGAIYGLRLLEVLAASDAELHLVASAWGERVVAEESGQGLDAHLERLGKGRVVRHAASDLSAPPASGSFRLDGCAIVPASMGTVGALASGTVANLVHRAGAVALKEGWPLVIAPRESPLSLIDLRNLTRLAEAGAAILPACPAFYHHPATIADLVDGFVSRILSRLGAANPLARPWSGHSEGEE